MIASEEPTVRQITVELKFINGCRRIQISVGDVWYIQDRRVPKDNRALRIVSLNPCGNKGDSFRCEALWSGRERLVRKARFNEKRGGLGRTPPV